jgi:ubiquitin carboxyl-terminal hydrolase 8
VPGGEGAVRRRVAVARREEWKDQLEKLSDAPSSSVVKAYAALVRHMWLEKATVVGTRGLKRAVATMAPQFRGSNQHDVQEFVSFLLDGLHEGLNSAREDREDDYSSPAAGVGTGPIGVAAPSDARSRRRFRVEAAAARGLSGRGLTLRQLEAQALKEWESHRQRHSSIIVDLFHGQLRSMLQCSKCAWQSVRFDPFMFLSLPLEGPEGRVTTLAQALEVFTTPEVLPADAGWRCPHCGPVVTVKKLDLWRLPPCLIVHLKRFKITPLGGRRKITAPVRFPLCTMDLSSNCASTRPLGLAFADVFKRRKASQEDGGQPRCEPVYDLYAVSNHHGGYGGGHYTAHCLHSVTGSWYFYNDGAWARALPDDVSAREAYLLFYSRMSSNPHRTEMRTHSNVVLQLEEAARRLEEAAKAAERRAAEAREREEQRARAIAESRGRKRNKPRSLSARRDRSTLDLPVPPADAAARIIGPVATAPSLMVGVVGTEHRPTSSASHSTSPRPPLVPLRLLGGNHRGRRRPSSLQNLSLVPAPPPATQVFTGLLLTQDLEIPHAEDAPANQESEDAASFDHEELDDDDASPRHATDDDVDFGLAQREAISARAAADAAAAAAALAASSARGSKRQDSLRSLASSVIPTEDVDDVHVENPLAPRPSPERTPQFTPWPDDALAVIPPRISPHDILAASRAAPRLSLWPKKLQLRLPPSSAQASPSASAIPEGNSLSSFSVTATGILRAPRWKKAKKRLKHAAVAPPAAEPERLPHVPEPHLELPTLALREPSGGPPHPPGTVFRGRSPPRWGGGSHLARSLQAGESEDVWFTSISPLVLRGSKPP